MNKIYLAETYGQMCQMFEIALRLRDLGHEITSRWINGDEEQLSREAAALMDVADVDSADTCLCFSLPPKTAHTGGGRHWEFGYGYATGKRIIIVGPKGEHIFHFLPGIVHCDTLEQAMGIL